MTATFPGSDTRTSSPLRRALTALRPGLGLALVCLGFSLHSGFRSAFWNQDYLPNILQQAATNIILAVGMTFVIITGGIDLSVGSVVALCGVALGMSAKSGPPFFMLAAMGMPCGVLAAAALARRAPELPRAARVGMGLAGWAVGVTAAWALVGTGAGLGPALAACLLLGTSCGMVNGLLVSFGRVPPFVATLGMLTAARGLAVYATDGNSVSGLPAALGVLGSEKPLIALSLAVVALGAIVMTRMRAGRYIAAIGGNEEAARLSGVAVPDHKTMAYVVSGVTAAIAAIVLTAKFQLADTGAGSGYELNAIAAVVIGGTSLSGGQGSVVGSFFGALTIAVLNAGLVLVGVRDTLQGVVIGGVIVATVVVDQIQRRGQTR